MPRIQRGDNNQHSTKKLVLYNYYNDQWHTETVSVTWTEKTEEQMSTIVQSWLHQYQELHKQAPSLTLQATTVTPHQELFISFDHNPLAHMRTTREKWYWLESLSKTIHAHAETVQNIVLMVNHELIDDTTLITQSPWPIDGFLNKSNMNS